VAPTGTLAIVAGTTSGIEPLFGLAYLRAALDGTEMPEVHPAFVAELVRRRLPVRRIVGAVMETGSLAGVRGVPQEMRRVFVTAHDIPLEWHIRLQAETQKHVDNAVSKTVNLPRGASVEAVERAFTLAWQWGCKGATVFRDGCRGQQVLHFGRIPAFAVQNSIARAHAEYAGECRLCSV
jgi:ribonucleoside-diphosphate reductase alpha chain